MPAIHPTALLDPRAEIAADVHIGPYCVIGPNVRLGAGCRLSSHVHLTGHTTVGAGTRIAPFASLGTAPQSVKFRGGTTRLAIGRNCDIRESVTMNVGTEDGGGLTEVGEGCLFMVGSHVGHDCRVGANVTVGNNVVLGGHVSVGDHVLFGGLGAVHQFVRIGEGAMLSGFSAIAADLIPFGFAIGQRGVLNGLNLVGMRRRGIPRTDMHRLRRFYRALFLGEGTFKQRLAATESEFSDDALIGKIFAFIHAGAKRPLLMPSRRHADELGTDAMP